MVICFDCSEEAKKALDDLIATGQYRNYAEIISLAIANHLLLHSHMGTGSHLLIKPPTEVGKERELIATRPAKSPTGAASVLGAFRIPEPGANKPYLAGISDDVFNEGDVVPVERWIFGQFNRLLPAKASCRALANLLVESVDGVDLNIVSIEVARAARVLGNELERRDTEHQADRDESLATAFPLSPSAEKGISRFANHFVGTINTRGQLSGLLASLKLIGRVDGKRKGLISLTEPGWDFGALHNPCIDDNTGTKLSNNERDFLCKHIRKHVPQESFAYMTILELASNGHDTPEKLDKALAKTASPKFEASESFVATQRSGAISRMSDLGLIARERQSTRVKYVVTDAGTSFLAGRSK